MKSVPIPDNTTPLKEFICHRKCVCVCIYRYTHTYVHMYNSSHIIYLQTSLLCLIMSEGQRSSFRRSGPGNSGGAQHYPRRNQHQNETSSSWIHHQGQAAELQVPEVPDINNSTSWYNSVLWSCFWGDNITQLYLQLQISWTKIKQDKARKWSSKTHAYLLHLSIHLSWKKIWLSIFIPKDNFMTKKQNDNLNIHGGPLQASSNSQASGPRDRAPSVSPALDVFVVYKKRTKMMYSRKKICF